MTNCLQKRHLYLVCGLALLMGLSAQAQVSINCNWVGTIYRENLGSGQYTIAAPFWGDNTGWSLLGANQAGTCLGGTPNNTPLVHYSVLILNASAPVIGANLGKVASVLAVNSSGTADINPTLTALTVTNSLLGLSGPTVGTLTTGKLTVNNSILGGGTYIVQNNNPSAPLNLFYNATFESSNLVFQGSGAAASFTGSLGLDQYTSRGFLSSLTGSSTAPILFGGVTIAGGTFSHPTATIAETGGGMLFFDTNTVNGAMMVGNFEITAASKTTFNGTHLEGRVSVNPEAILNLSTGNISAGGVFNSTQASLYISGTVTNQLSGQINNFGYLENDGTLNNGGTIDNRLRATIDSYGAINNSLTGAINNAGNFLNTYRLSNSGQLNNNLTATLDNYSRITNNLGGTFTNDGTFTNQSIGAVDNYGVLRNSGAFNNNSGAQLGNFGSITNSGTFLVASGAHVTNNTGSGGGTYRQTAGSTVVNGVFTSPTTIQINGGTLQGDGTIQGDVAMYGTLSPGNSPGRLTITGNYTQGSGGSFFAELAGLTAGTQYDQLVVGQTANLQGTLDVVLLPGFTLQVGDSFKLMTFAHENGQFSAYDLPTLNSDEYWKWTYDATDFTLSVASPPTPTPEPGSLLLLGSGLLGMAGMRGRKRTA